MAKPNLFGCCGNKYLKTNNIKHLKICGNLVVQNCISSFFYSKVNLTASVKFKLNRPGSFLRDLMTDITPVVNISRIKDLQDVTYKPKKTHIFYCSRARMSFFRGLEDRPVIHHKFIHRNGSPPFRLDFPGEVLQYSKSVTGRIVFQNAQKNLSPLGYYYFLLYKWVYVWLSACLSLNHAKILNRFNCNSAQSILIYSGVT